MPDENDSAVSAGIANLEQIKQGDDPRADGAHANPRVRKVQHEVNRLCIEHEMPAGLDRSRINCYVADWQRKIGNCKYHRKVEPDEYGKRVTGIVNSHGWYSVGIATRAFDSKDTWKDTVAHELAHVFAYVRHVENGNATESPGHDHRWKAEARRLGADPTRTDRVSPENQVDAEYFLGCPNGCFRNGKQVRSKRVKHPGRYRCPECETKCASWEAGDERPSAGGTCAVDLS